MFPKRYNSNKRGWSPSEVAFLQQNADSMKDEELAKKLNRTLKSVREKRKRLNLTKGHGRGHFKLVRNSTIKTNALSV